MSGTPLPGWLMALLELLARLRQVFKQRRG